MMTNTLSLRSLVLLSATMALAACGSDSSTGPGSNQPVDVNAAIAAASTFGVVGSNAGLRSALGLPTTSTAPAVTPSLCTYSATTGSFACPTATVGGLTFETSYFLYDASQQSQSAADPATTAAVRVVGDVTGTVNIPAVNGTSGTVTVDRHADFTLSGLLTVTRALNGLTSEHDDVTTTGGVASHVKIDLTSTTANVVLPELGAPGQWPLSGTVTAELATVTTAGSLPAVPVSAHAVLTFNGTSVVPVATTIGGVTRTCRVDLSRSAAPNCS
jgi:hypothetical protein